MKTLKITEVFYSIQGEGARAGDPSIFIRLAGCNLTCGFCDTEFASGKDMTWDQLDDAIIQAIKRAGVTPNTGETHPDAVGHHWIVWTGGEPTEQLTADHVARFKNLGWKQAIETNGTNPVPEGLDFVCVSPKVAEHVLAKNFPNGVNELRYVRHAGQPGVPEPAIKADYKLLSPMFDGNRPNPDNLRHCMRLCLENPQWSLSLQLHKLVGVL